MLSSPPTALATTGMPHAAASRATSPKLSLRLGTTTTSAARYQLDRMWCGCGATNRTRSATPSSAARRRAAAASASPSTPLAPPTMTSTASGMRRQRGEGADGHVGRLQRLDAPDEQDDRPVDGQPDGAPRAGPVAGGEEGVLDGRRDDLDAPGRVAVQAAELALLLRAADADGVAAADDVGLGPVAPRRLEVAALGLDPGQRVERRHERHVEGVLEAVPDDAAQPVVAVDDVDARARRRGARARRR